MAFQEDMMKKHMKGYKGHDDGNADKSLVKKMVKPDALKERKCGGKVKRAGGGAVSQPTWQHSGAESGKGRLEKAAAHKKGKK